MGTMQAINKNKGFKNSPCYLVFYDDSIAVIGLDSKFKKTESKAVTKELKAQKIGLFKRPKELEKYWEEYGLKYEAMSLEDALAEEKTNFSIKNSNVTEIIFKRRKIDKIPGGETMDHPGHIQIVADKKYGFIHLYEEGNDKEAMIIKIFKDKFEVKKNFRL